MSLSWRNNARTEWEIPLRSEPYRHIAAKRSEKLLKIMINAKNAEAVAASRNSEEAPLRDLSNFHLSNWIGP